MLEKFRQVKLKEIEKLKSSPSFEPFNGNRENFVKSLLAEQTISIIAEYKRASPSLGIIRQDLEVEEIVNIYANSGASAISILTEEKYFDGDINYLHRAYQSSPKKIPLLRKDFIFDPIQIEATAPTPASAILLIARLIPTAYELRKMKEFAESFGLSAVIEVFNKEDLHKAKEAGANIIQVNARDLQTLEINQNRVFELIHNNPPLKEEIWIAASGIKNRMQIQKAQDYGYHAVLVGSWLMQNQNPGQALKNLLLKG